MLVKHTQSIGAKMIKLLILDVDGILTDGKKYYDREGNVRMKTFCDKDWTAIKRFRALGIQVVFLTGDPFNVTIAENRNIDVYVNRTSDGVHKDKIEFLADICIEYEVAPSEVAYAGDDIFDARIMKAVYYSFCPSDAPGELKKIATTSFGMGGQNFVMNLFDWMRNRNLLPGYDFDEHLEKVYELDRKEKF